MGKGYVLILLVQIQILIGIVIIQKKKKLLSKYTYSIFTQIQVQINSCISLISHLDSHFDQREAVHTVDTRSEFDLLQSSVPD